AASPKPIFYAIFIAVLSGSIRWIGDILKIFNLDMILGMSILGLIVTPVVLIYGMFIAGKENGITTPEGLIIGFLIANNLYIGTS
ncbi:MAG: hypothetical protein AABZ14_08500, partial [Candidatus Margulisiibacteriota bacterium]